jgi:hypothetical protein
MSRGRATIWSEGSWLFVRTPYDKEWIAELKIDIPYAGRKWDADQKLWKVDPAYLDDLIDVTEKYFDVSVINPNPEPEVVMISAGAETDAYSRMLKLASPGLLKKVYRLIASEIHPDKGGPAHGMVELNAAWDEIKKTL